MAEISIPGYAVLLNTEEYVPTGTEKTIFIENLNEIGDRRARQSVNTLYIGEDSSPEYYWQPMTLCYEDITYGSEVWRVTSTNDAQNNWLANEYGYSTIWSADGKRMFLGIDVDTSAFTRTTTSCNYVMTRADGSKYRVAHDASCRSFAHRYGLNWSPIEPDTFYQVGSTYENNSSISTRFVYKNVVADGSIIPTQWVDLGSTGDRAISKTMGGDGKKAMVFQHQWGTQFAPSLAVTLYPVGSLDASWDFDSANRLWPAIWGSGTPNGDVHNMWMRGNSVIGYWLVANTYPSAHDFWKLRPEGPAADGGPEHTNNDGTAPYLWETNEDTIKPVNTGYYQTTPDPWCDDGDAATDCLPYMGHQDCYADGQVIVFSSTDATPIDTGTYNIENHVWEVETQGNSWGVQHSGWTGFTDFTVSVSGAGDRVWTSKYNAIGHASMICNPHEQNANLHDDAGVIQSPDGTKVAYISNFCNATYSISESFPMDYADIYWAVAYYPYPPEITNCSATGGTITTRFDWRLDQASPRSYTTRGWPDPSVDDPPPPRETELFRLWRSSDGVAWTPVNTGNADIFTKFDFPTGNVWNGGQTSYWEITDNPGDGTWYYAVTSKEWSGLESRTLSNVFTVTVSGGAGTGSQSTAYPTVPGGDAGFNTTFNSGAIRYYNVYASDDGTPSILQTFRIASIPANEFSGATCSWVDWLGLTNGSTQYRVTAVDTLGNESSAVYVTGQRYTHQQAPATAAGQYTIEWSKMH